jgi:methylmalonyl-CoA mutase cobalamin-binding domain/chain
MPVPATRTRRPRRILTAVPLCDGHDSAISTINLELARHGAEVIYLGYHQSASAIARAAVQEDVDAIGLSSYNGGHVVFFREVLAQLRTRGGGDIPVFGGGGGTITAADERALQRAGVTRIFGAGTPLDHVVAMVLRDSRPARRTTKARPGDGALGRAISRAEAAARRRQRADDGVAPGRRRISRTFTVGVAGPGGAGKSTLIDELAARYLRTNPTRRLAILANDPSRPDTGGAILGDRVSAIYAQDDRVFFRSLATRGSLTGISAATPAAIELLRRSGEFDFIFVESIGVGQESDPFRRFGPGAALVDATVLVLSPHYGGQIQLQKIALLNGADFVVLNKCDDLRATTARRELDVRLRANGRDQSVYATIAAQHDDVGVARVFAALAALAGHEPPGGEKPCLLELAE